MLGQVPASPVRWPVEAARADPGIAVRDSSSPTAGSGALAARPTRAWFTI